MNKPAERLNLLKPKEQPFADDPAKSYTLPASWYYDPEIYDREKYAIFYKSWHYTCHASQVAEPGSYFTTRIHDQNIFVIRGEDNELRGFYNVCQHRGHELVNGSGRTKLLVCPYHAWSYKSDGSLMKARNADTSPGFDPCNFALKQVQVEVFLGMVMVNCDLQAESFGETMTGLKEEILSYVPEADNLLYAKRQQYPVESNWKVLIDNFLECYHCHVAHRDFVDLVNMDAYNVETHQCWSSHCSKGPVNAASTAYSVQTDVDFSYAAWFIWPNITLWCMPGEPNLSVLQMNPNGVETTLEYLDWFLTSPELSPEMQQASTYLDEVLQPEDIGLCESVQRGLKSIGYNQGRFIVDEDLSELSEHGVHHFQKLVLEALLNSSSS
jgi:phenylpropionate dioxygenase-like ring-hydroxylating dioxygenase large terminal subunit